MRKPILLLFLSFTFLVSAQESYEFKTSVPPEAEIVTAVDPGLFGTYKNELTGTEFVFNAEGVTMVTIINSFISKEQVRETSKYQVRNGYLFGVKENDSIPCILEGDKYFFGIRQKVTLNDASQKALIKRISNQSYVINFIETKGYSPSMMSFKGNTLLIQHFTYPAGTDVFNHIAKKEKSKEKAYDLILLNPNQSEWNKLDKTVIFDQDALVFVKQ